MTVETQNLTVAIDGRMLASGGTGVSTYAQALHGALSQLGHAPLIVADASSGAMPSASGRIERWIRWLDALIDRSRRLETSRHELRARDLFRLANVHFDRHGTVLRLKAHGHPGIMHWTYPLPMTLVGWTNVYTVHDAIPLTHPELTPIDSARHRRLLGAIQAAGGRIMTVSEAARRDLARALGSEGAISAVATGIAPASATIIGPAGLPAQGYFLCVGSVEPRKNLLRLVEAHRASETDLPLVIAGPSGWHAEAIEPCLAVAPDIIRLPYPSRPELMALIANARALLFPTLAEGFGLPIVEAMALGTPVLTSRGGATEEIAGGAALLASADEVDDIAAAIARLTHDDALRADLVRAGRARAEHFTLDAFADRLKAFHHSLPEIPVG